MTTAPVPPLRVAVIGMGGFAGAHHRALRALEASGVCRVAATCDPNPAAFAGEDYDARGVRIYDDYRRMLDAHAGELDVVTVPTPVPLHAEMHRACVERGLACYLEKPPTLYHAELDAMLAVEAGAARQTVVGFNFIAEEPRQALKRRILGGEFGPLRRVGFVGVWPRATTYFTRAPWAGRLLLNDRPVLDSCIGNALAHYIHNLLFWGGTDALLSWAEVAEAEAELYRAHAIENFDTAFVRGECANGTEIRIAATHACTGRQYQREIIECASATITYVTWEGWEIAGKDGRSVARSDTSGRETGPADRRDLLIANFAAYFEYLRGVNERPLTRLIDARPFVHLINLIPVAAKHIADVPAEHVHRSPAPSGDGEHVAIAGVAEACEAFIASGAFPTAQNRPWAAPGGRATAREIPDLLGVIRRMHGKA